ncbi:hypothetical protein FA95DRAFT_1449785, partial [Auriscalpium vulgare]
MLKVGKKYNTNFSALRLSTDLKKKMPAWYHLSTKSKRTVQATKCLKENHDVVCVADLMKTMNRLTGHVDGRPHYHMRRCACRDCARDRARGCENPHACAAEAKERISLINQKLNPNDPPPQDSLTLTRHRKRQNLQNLELNREVKFDPATTCKTDLSECIRIFQSDDPETTAPPTRLANPAAGIAIQDERVTVYTDGSCINNG